MSQTEGSNSGERQELDVVSKRIKPKAHSGLVFIKLKGQRYELDIKVRESGTFTL